MSKRHHASRRRAYGRRQHEVRERADRPDRERIDLTHIVVHDIDGYDELLLDRLLRPEPAAVSRAASGPMSRSMLPGID
jgi:hypothetical protein